MRYKIQTYSTMAILLISMYLPAQVSVLPGANYKYLKGSEATALPADWKTAGFDDSGWLTGNAPFYFGFDSQGVELSDMRNSYSTLFMRKTITVSNPTELESVFIGTNCDDGYAIWINGQLVESKNAPDEVLNQIATVNLSLAAATRRSNAGTFSERIYSASSLPLIAGENIIAVCALNQGATSSDFYFDLKMSSLSNLPVSVDSIGVSFSLPSGFYESNMKLTLSHTDPSYKIAYTVDGSNPMYSNSVITGQVGKSVTVSINPDSTYGGVRGITPAVVIRAAGVKTGYAPAISESRTYIFPEKVKTQDNPGYPWPEEGSGPNGQAMYYVMNPEVVESPVYKDSIIIALKDIPTLSLITDNDSLFGSSGGIYVNAGNSGREWERNCSFELINPDGSQGFAINAGLRIRGRASRGSGVPKHSFRMFFRSEYGKGKLEYPLFGDEGVDKFDKIDLRTAQNYAWHFNNPERNTFVREVFARDAQRDAGQPYTRSRYYHLYINGMYWGMYQTQERSEARFSADYLGGTSDDYDVIKMSNEGNSSAEEHMLTATDGTTDKWSEVYNKTLTGFESDKSYFALEGKDENGNMNAYGEVLVDIDNLIDYMINIFYTGNFDAPITKWAGTDGANKWLNNMYAITNREDRLHGFKFYIHDAEHSLFVDPPDPSLRYIPGIGLYENRVYIGDDTIPLERRMTVDQFEYFHPQWLHHKLCDNDEYKQRFADRAMHQLTGNGVWTPDACLKRFNSRVSQIEKAIIAESARWGDFKTSQITWGDIHGFTKDSLWLEEINSIRTGYFPYRTDILIDQLKAAGLYSTLDAPLFKNGTTEFVSVNNLTGTVNVKLENPNANGTIYYTTDGTDPRDIGGAVSAGVSSIVSGGSVSVSQSVNICARVFYENEWSGLKTVSFLKEQVDYSMLKVTELHYHPLDGYEGLDTIDDSKYEFIEFKNTGSEPINLSGLVLDSAVYYKFPENTLLGAGEYYVVAAKPSYFFDRYGVLPSGNYSNKLSNGGERVVVYKAGVGNVIDFTYDDAFPWPTQPDGRGMSLVSVEDNPTGFPASIAYWTSSDEVHGNPFGITALPDNVEEISVEDTYMIYPNPTDNMIYVRNSNREGSVMNVAIYDLNGRLCCMDTLSDMEGISLSQYGISYGMYIVKVESEGKVETKKIIYNP